MLVDTQCYPQQADAGDAHRIPSEGVAERCCAAPSGNTERAVRSDLVIYCAWCREQGATAVPASARTVDAMAKRCAPTTVRRCVSSIKLGGAHDGVLWKWVPLGGRRQRTLKKAARSLGPQFTCPVRSIPAHFRISLPNIGDSEQFSEMRAASWSRPRVDKHGEMRSRSQPKFLKVWATITEAYPSTEL